MPLHVHLSAVHMVAFLAFSVAILGTVHLVALTVDNRASRAYIALGL